ncbi:glycoside hydrolase family 28 protein [Alteromonas pelagimontana]|uniref:Glycoside hydrolase family 28 protein n=1 Tax=Alteromonas pelagimontana TaxID=1858656 RepID=A0A6M4MDE6_9ALTE|nr:glycoside hydrolase family 28 protein [Alteromonas pelagimontana]QJR81109.1 glycoside hydrolase family 28 protein [Alteromonas pelagimontana]
MRTDRRTLLKLIGHSATTAGLLSLSGCSSAIRPTSDFDWDTNAAAIRSRIVPPTFPERSASITDFGAKPGKQNDCTQAIADAIAHIAQQGGGTVTVPEGAFYTGPVHLKSNINFHIAKGAVLHFIPEPERYKPYVFTRWEGTELYGYSPLIYAFEQTNIAVTGEGTLEGGASETIWWPWKGPWKEAKWGDDPEANQKNTRDPLRAMAEKGVPVEERVFEKNYLRPPFIQPYRCKNVLISGVTIRNSPFWLVNPVLCTNVTVKDIYCHSYGPNSDGCDPESCTDVLIENCTFDTGDDCIAVKSGRNADGRRVAQPCENILINNCQMKAGHGGVVIGSEISGGVRNLYAQNCEMSSPNLDRGIRIKTNSLRGGHLQNLNYRNLRIGQVKDAIVINFFYEEGDVGNFTPKLEGIRIENLYVQHAQRAFVLLGYDHTPITGVTFKSLTFEKVDSPSVIENVADITQQNIVINGKKAELPNV